MRPAAAASPTRTLFVRGLSLSTTETELMAFFSVYGDIRRVTSFVDTKGIAFVTFFDLRHAEVSAQRFFFSHSFCGASAHALC
jgi:RNA recognition motif-containing protein